MLEDRYYEQDKVFKNIADACYNLVKYEYLKEVAKDENKNISKGTTNII